jgi:2',3'-cyclic-nucleotide 2'-phosphodiesterase/3'-nucleotidase
MNMTVSPSNLCIPTALGHASVRLRLRILATSDLHANLFPFNYYTDVRDDEIGLAGLAGLVAEARRDHPNLLLFDNGDTLQGAPLGDAAIADIMPEGAPHPMISAMNALGYDAATVGNHDFDYGLDLLQSAYGAARFPVVLANAVRSSDGRSLMPRRAVLTRDFLDECGKVRRLRIGVTGVAPPQIETWSHAQLGGAVRMGDMVTAVTREVACLRAAGADLVVVLGHTGLGCGRAGWRQENVAATLARLPGVDVVIAGHTHDVFPGAAPQIAGADIDAENGRIGAAVVVQPGFWGSHLGVVDLCLSALGAGRAAKTADGRVAENGAPAAGVRAATWQVETAMAVAAPRPRSIEGARGLLKRAIRSNPRLRAQMASSHRRTRRYTARPLGQSDTALETYFSLLAPCAATQLVADAQRAAAAPIVAADPTLAQLPLLSAVAPFKAGGRGGPANYTDIPAGPLLLRHAADLYLYPNALCLVRVSGRHIRTWLERVAAAFRTIRPDPAGASAPQPLLCPEFASYNFDRLSGLRYRFDLSRPARTDAAGTIVAPGSFRVRDLQLADGSPVFDDGAYLVVSNSYRVGGGGRFPALGADCLLHTSAVPVRDAIAAFIQAQTGPISLKVEPTWGFCSLGGTRVAFDTGPGARAYGARAASLGLRHEGQAEQAGFDRYTITL